MVSNSERKEDFINHITRIEFSQTDNLIASTNKTNFISINKTLHKNSINPETTTKNENVTKSKSQLLKKIINKYNKAESKNNRLLSDSKGLGLIITGITLMAAGTVILWLVSILIGIILLPVGLILFIIGAALRHGKKRNNIGSNNNNIINDLPEVVYLKNGSIIKCTVIEQVIDDYIKIKTSDGSIYVYKMTEVEKIVKD